MNSFSFDVFVKIWFNFVAFGSAIALLAMLSVSDKVCKNSMSVNCPEEICSCLSSKISTLSRKCSESDSLLERYLISFASLASISWICYSRLCSSSKLISSKMELTFEIDSLPWFFMSD